MTTRQLDMPSALPERTYYVSPRRARGRRRRRPLLPSLVLAAALFSGGFFLGRSAAAEQPPLPAEGDSPPAVSLPLSAADPAPAPVEVLSLPESHGDPAEAQDASVPGAGLLAAAPAPEQTGEGRRESPPSGGGAAAASGAAAGTPAAPAQGAETGEDWALLLVNGDHPLPEDFAAPELTELKNGHRVDSRAYPALQRMMDAARAEGLSPLICSSYRTWDKQSQLYSRKVQSLLDRGLSQAEAEAEAATWVARPGTSEHQTGLAVDIVDLGYQLLDEGQEQTPVQQWLLDHCGEYGFILRYPTGKSDLTGVGYEPWHYRYVGDAAREIMDGGLCLEEYLAKNP